MNAADAIPLLLLVLITLSVGAGIAMAVMVARAKRRGTPPPTVIRLAVTTEVISLEPQPMSFQNRPHAWLAIKSRNLNAVQAALGLHHVKPCSRVDGLSGNQKLFLAPPVKDWVLVFGPGLPEPSDDVDICYRFLLNLSRKIGQVQFFAANRVLHHHAWVRAERGRVVRAYAWAGATLWQQGRITRAEAQLHLRCFDYLEPCVSPVYGVSDAIVANVERVPLLAARWSIDPAAIDDRLLSRERGLAGDFSCRF